MSNRRYVKRVWRVPKHRGALEYFATLVVKALVKHGWPAKWRPDPFTGGFLILHVDGGESLPDDMEHAARIAVRVTARMYRVEVVQSGNFVALDGHYEVTAGGHFKLVKA